MLLWYMLKTYPSCDYTFQAYLPAPFSAVGFSKKYLYFLRPSGWCHTASGRLTPQSCMEKKYLSRSTVWTDFSPYLKQNVIGFWRYTLQWRWCAECPSVLLLQKVEVRLTSSSSGTVWLVTGGSCIFLLSVGTGSSDTYKDKWKILTHVWLSESIDFAFFYSIILDLRLIITKILNIEILSSAK